MKLKFRKEPTTLAVKKRGKVFYRMLYSYLIILLLPLFLSLFVFNRAQEVLADEAERANGLLLNQMREYCDKLMTDALSITSLVNNNSRITGLIYEEGQPDRDIYYRAFSAAEDFENYLLANRNITSFYVYMPALNMVISPFGFYSTHSFYKNHLQNLELSFHEWLSRFLGIDGHSYDTFQTTDMSERLIPTMAVFTPLPITDVTGDPPAVCVVEVDMRKFTSLMEDSVWTDQSILAIYDRDKGILLSSGEYDISGLETVADLQDSPSGFYDVINLSGNRFALLLSQSEVAPWTYISLIPLGIYNDRFNDLLSLVVLFFIICAVLGGVLVYFSTRNRYKPIKDILSLVQPEGEGDVNFSNDEFNMIARNITLTMAEDSRLKREMEESMPVLRQRELRLLLKGEVEDDPQEKGRLAKLGMTFTRKFFILVLVDIELEEDAPSHFREECLTKLQYIRDESEYLFTVKDLDGHVAYLINRDRDNYHEILEAMAKIRESVEKEYPVTVAMGLSGLHTRDIGFPRLYWEAKRALAFRLVKGRSRPILYEDVWEASHSYYYPMEQEIKLIAAIQSGSDQEAFQILDTIFKENFGPERNISIEMGTCLMYEMIATLVKAMEKVLNSEEDGRFWRNLSPIHRLMGSKSLEVLKLEMEKIFYQVCSHIRRGKKSHNDELRHCVESYVEEHLFESGLCVEEIAQHCNRNPAYLARFFKEQTAMGLAFHIKSRRVEESFERLLDDKKTIATIAEEVGFTNANAFIRAYKEIKGITPGQFREKRFL